MRLLILFLALTPLLFAYSELNIYNDKAQLFKKEKLASNVIGDIPRTIFNGSFVIYTPNIRNYIFKNAQQTSIYDVLNSYINKAVFYKGKKVRLRLLNRPDAIIELPNGKLKTVKLGAIVFPPYKGSFSKVTNHVVLPKKFKGSEFRYGYLFRGIRWKSSYTLVLDKNNEAQLKGSFEITNDTDIDYHPDMLRLIAGSQNSSMHPPVMYMRSSKSIRNVRPVTAVEDVQKAPLQNYYSYTYTKKIILPAKSKKLLSFINKRMSVTKKYTSGLSNPKYFGGENRFIPDVVVTFKAFEAMPSGRVMFLDDKRVYLGDTILPNTPKGGDVTLRVGKDFFSIIKERAVDTRRFKNGFRSIVEYTLENRSKEERVYELLVPLQEARSVSIMTQKHYRFKNGDTLLFKIRVAPGKKERFEITYEQRK